MTEDEIKAYPVGLLPDTDNGHVAMEALQERHQAALDEKETAKAAAAPYTLEEWAKARNDCLADPQRMASTIDALAAGAVDTLKRFSESEQQRQLFISVIGAHLSSKFGPLRVSVESIQKLKQPIKLNMKSDGKTIEIGLENGSSLILPA